MPTFSYIAKNKDGQDVRSSLDAATRLDALEALRKKGLTVVDLFSVEPKPAAGAAKKTAAPKPAPAADKTKKSFSFSSKVKMTDLA
ncbi:hypothetical protein, partial [Pontiella sp.]